MATYNTIASLAVAAGYSSSTPVSQAITKQMVSFEAKITNGSTVQRDTSRVKIYFAPTTLTLTAGNVKSQLGSAAILAADCKVGGLGASAVKIHNSFGVIIPGSTVWVWADGELNGSVTLDINIFEVA